MRFQRLSVFSLVVALLLTVPLSSVALSEEPLTVNGVVLGFNDKPVAGWPIHLNALLPDEMSCDRTNVYYKLPGYDQHLTYTDENGRFTMTGVIDYPQVLHHKYRLWSVDESATEMRLKSNPFIRTMETIDLSKATSGQVYVVVKGEPGAALKVTARYPDGSPFSGTLSVGIIAGVHTYVKPVTFKDGVGISISIPVGGIEQPGRVIFLPMSIGAVNSAAILAKGKDLSIASLKEDGVIADKRVRFAPFQWATCEITVPN